ncbi:glycosyltransferase [Candidatus Saccharibacteria bacterium]|nr:glycosyltransferase [Candidatus Saccharibacteria bacterium]
MKIGLFSDRYLPNTDGVTYSIESFRIQLELMGHEVFIIAPADSLRHKETNPKVIRFPAVKGLFFDDYSTSLFFPPQIVRKIDKLGLDIVHYQTPGQVGMLGAYFAIHKKIPLVTTYHTDLFEYVTHYPAVLPGIIALSMLGPIVTGGGMDEYRTGLSAIKPERSIDKWNQKIVERGVTMVHNHCDMVIAPSEKMMMQLKGWQTSAPMAILPTGIDEIMTTKAEINAARKHYGITETDEVILFVGRVGGEKNIELLVRAFALISKHKPTAKLLVIGEGPVREDMIKLAESEGLSERISFPGQVLRTKLGAIYALARVFAFPSLADTQGLVVNEAALAGLPIVMIDPHISEIMRDGVTGLYARPNAKDLAAKIVQLLDDPALGSKLGAAARRLALSYSASAQATKLLRLYEEAIKHYREHSSKAKIQR